MNNASSYEEQKRSEEELEQLRKAAESGDKNAMCEYGLELFVLNKKFSKAFRWLERSKDLNVPVVWEILGLCYLYGKGTDKNIKEAVNCFLRVIELGDIGGAFYIFHISHKYDDYVNFDEVVRIFEQLNSNLPTENVDVEYISMLKFMLACCYYWGVGTEKNEGQAKKLLKSAGYDFDEDNTPLFIKKIIMAFPFPKRFPICYNFLRPFQEKFIAFFSMSFKWFYYTVESTISSNEATAKELYDFLIEKDHDGRWFYLKVLPKVNANLMDIALLENNFSNFCDVCLKEPNFIECVLLHDRFIKTFQYIDDPLYISHPEFDIENEANFVLDKSHRFVINLLGFSNMINLSKKFNCNILETRDLSVLIHSKNIQITSILGCIFVSHGLFKIGKLEKEISLNEEDYIFFKDLTHLVNQQEYSEEINEFKKYCINTPKILDGFEFTKEELSSIFGIVEENPDNKIETINAKDVSIPDTYKCITFDGCEEAYKKFFEKLKEIDYIDESTSFEIFKVAIGLEPAPEEGFFPRVIWKPVYRSGPYWRPLLNMLRLIGIKREDIKPKIINSLFVHPTGKKIDSNVIKVHKATVLIEFNGKKQSIHKHLCDFLEKSGFPSDKLIHNLDE